MGTEVAAKLQWILCFGCYIKENYVIKGRFKRTNNGEKPTFVKDENSPPNEFSVTVNSENKVGVFEPLRKIGRSKEVIEWLINKHIIVTTNDCLPKETPETKMRIKQAKVAISKFEKNII